MGEFRNEHSNKWNPYGGWEYGEDLSEAIARAESEGDEEVAAFLRRFASRCRCCGKRFDTGTMKGRLCATCRNHARCSFCSEELAEPERRAELLCGQCNRMWESFKKRVAHLDPVERSKKHAKFMEFHSVWVCPVLKGREA